MSEGERQSARMVWILDKQPQDLGDPSVEEVEDVAYLGLCHM